MVLGFILLGFFGFGIDPIANAFPAGRVEVLVEGPGQGLIDCGAGQKT